MDKQFCVNISIPGVFCWLQSTNYMLEALCRKETTGYEIYSRIFMLWSVGRQETTCSKHVVLRKCILTTFCTKKKLQVEGTVQGKDDVLTAYDKNVLNVARRNDKLRDVFRGDGILWTFSQPGDSMVTTRYGRNSMLQLTYRREMIY